MKDIITPAELFKTIGREGITAICFHSPRSAYCRRMVQRLLQDESTCPLVGFYLVDADNEAFLPVLLKYDVVALPTFQVFQGGIKTKFLVGEHGEQALARHLSHWFGTGQPNAQRKANRS